MRSLHQIVHILVIQLDPTWIEEGQTGQSFIIRNLSGGGTVARMVLTGLDPSSTYELTTFVQQIAGSLNHGHRIDVKWETIDHPYEYQVNLLYSGTGEEYHARHHTWILNRQVSPMHM